MTFDVADHPKLSAASKALRDAAGGSLADPSPEFVADVEAAELTLGLSGLAFEGRSLETARLAVVLQLNLQQESSGGRVTKSETRGERRVDYADAAPGTAGGLVHGLARQLADRLLASIADGGPTSEEAWAVVGNTR